MNSYNSNALTGTAGGLMIAILSTHSAISEEIDVKNVAVLETAYHSGAESQSAVGIRPYRVDGDLDINSRYTSVLSTFYESLMSSQQMLGTEIEEVIISNLSSLYIE